MAGFISTTVAPQSSIIAQTQQATTTPRAAAQGVNPSSVQQPNSVAQAAAVVHVSANTKKRGVSSGTGENKALDGAFEKEENKKLADEEEEKKEAKGEEKKTGGVVNVEA